MKFVIKLNTILMSSLLVATFSCYAGTTLQFQPVIRDDARVLGDLVIIHNDTQHWSALPLESFPAPGEIVTKTHILDWMVQHLGPIDFHWQGKTHIKINPSIKTPASALIKKAKTALMAQLKPHYTRVQLDVISQVQGSSYGLDDLKTEITLHYPTAKRVCVWLIHENPHQKRIPIWFKVRAYTNVWVAKRRLSKNTLIENKSFNLEERNIAGLITAPAKSIPQHLMINTSITRNTILMNKMLKSPPLVTQGKPVKVTLHHHQITLIIDAIALEDGRLGQTITVKNQNTQQRFAARISGFQQAEAMP